MKGGKPDPALQSKLMKKLKKKYNCPTCKKVIYNQSIKQHQKSHLPLTLKFKKMHQEPYEWYVVKSGTKKRSKKSTKKQSKKRSSKKPTKKQSKKRSSKKSTKKSSKKQSKKQSKKRSSKKSYKKSTKKQSKKLSKKQKECQRKKIGTVMGEFKQKKLKSSSGKKVTNPKQAIAIALSVARKYCA